MILMTINQAQKKVLLTSVPRDLWINGGRINATFTGAGWEAMQDAFEKVSGQRPVAYIQCDFEDMVWLVDAMGGLEVELDSSFTDEEYPNDELKTYVTVSFEKGLQKIDGKSALVLSRSRHGNNGEGSDFKRMERQHKILKAMPEAVLSSKSIFNPLNIPKFYQTITEGHLVTNLSLNDVKALWDFYSIRKEYQMESFYIASDYLINPPMSEYGGAWVLIAPNNDYSSIHSAIKQKALLSSPSPEKIVSTHSQSDEPEKATGQ
jgi:LCP family protein required for cell wall assembly